MSDQVSVRLGNRELLISEDMKAEIREELPEADWIRDKELYSNVLVAWAAAIAASSFSRLGDMKPSGNFNTRPLRHGTQADHLRSVTRLAVHTAREMSQLFPSFSYDEDLLIAGCLCHDIGKVWEFDPANTSRWSATPGKVGVPSIRHPAYGAHICLSVGLPEEVAHMAAAHSGEGELLSRSLENTILRWADVTFWRVVEAGGQLLDEDRWLSTVQA